MTKLNQLIAVESGIKNQAHLTETRVYHMLQKAALLGGISRTYQPRDEEGEQLPAESTRVQIQVSELLREMTGTLARLFDVTASKDKTNCVARADVVLEGGDILLSDVPVTYLLFLEKQLVALRALISRIPVLDPSENWTYSETANAWASQPAQTTRTKKTPRSFTKAKPTAEHPEQAELYWEDVVVGYYTTTKFSGAMPAARVRDLLERVDDLARSVKFAREEANGAQVVDFSPGRTVLDYLFAA